MLIHICSFLVIIPAAALCLFPMKNQLRHPLRLIILRMALLFLAVIPAAAFLVYHFGFSINSVLLPMLFLLFLVYHGSLKVPLCKSLAVFLWVCSLMAIFANFSSGIDAYLYPQSGADIESIESSAIQLGISLFTCLLFYKPVSEFASRLIDRLNINNIWYMTMPFSLIFLGLNLALRPIRYESLYVNKIFRTYWIVISTNLVMWMLMTTVFYFIVIGLLNALETREHARILEMQESQFVAQQQYMENSARVRHDFRQMIHTLRELLAAKNYPAAEEFIEKYAEELPENEIVRYCPNTALNALLNHYAQVAGQADTAYEMKIDLPDAQPLSDVELCGVVGNILENAVDACKRMKEGRRWIRLTILPRNEALLFIVATNSFSGKVRMIDGHYLSTGKMGSGLGLDSITATVERHHGSVRFSHSENEFYTDIVIPINDIN